METSLKTQTDFMNWVANLFVENFLEFLYRLNKEKKYCTYVGILAELLDWSTEFSEQYYNKIVNWELFKWSSSNIYKAACLHDFIIAFGYDKIEKLYSKNENPTGYFLEKYLAFQSNND